MTTLQVTDRGGVPSGVATVVLNVTVTEPAGAGFATVFPCGIDPPLASNLNYAAGNDPKRRDRQVGTNGTVCITANQAVHLIADVVGYFPEVGAAVARQTVHS